MKRLKIGDLLEIKTNKGYFYAQYTHQVESYGTLVRVFNNSCPSRPDNIAEILNGDIRLTTFFPLRSAIKRGDVVVVGNYPVRSDLVELPIFRIRGVNFVNPKAAIWFLWDGVNKVKVDQLSDEQKGYPIASVLTYELFIHRLETGWTLREDGLS